MVILLSYVRKWFGLGFTFIALSLLLTASGETSASAISAACLSADKEAQTDEIILASGLNAGIESQRRRLAAAIEKTGLRTLRIRTVELDEFKPGTIVEQLRAQKVAINGPIVTLSGIIAGHLARESPTWPVVFVSLNDPVEAKLVSSLGPRSENLTGVTFAIDLEWKALEHLRLAFPKVRSVAILLDEFSAQRPAFKRLPEQAERLLGLQVSLRVAESPDSLTTLLAKPDNRQIDAWYVPETAVLLRHEDFTMSSILKLGKPVLFAHPSLLKKGAVMVFGAEFSSLWEEVAQMLRLVCTGTSAREIPIVRPHRIFLGVSAANARRQGIDIDPRIFKLATVIE